MAGGINQYGYAGGDPVNFSDPFGLCRENDATCRQIVALLRSESGSAFQEAANRFEATSKAVHIVPGGDSRLASDDINRNGNPNDFVGGRTTEDAVYLNGDFSVGDLTFAARHESDHVAGLSHRSPEQNAQIEANDREALSQMSGDKKQTAHRAKYAVHGTPLPSTVTETKQP